MLYTCRLLLFLSMYVKYCFHLVLIRYAFTVCKVHGEEFCNRGKPFVLVVGGGGGGGGEWASKGLKKKKK